MKEAQIVATIHRIGEDFIALADYLTAYVKEEQSSSLIAASLLTSMTNAL